MFSTFTKLFFTAFLIVCQFSEYEGQTNQQKENPLPRLNININVQQLEAALTKVHVVNGQSRQCLTQAQVDQMKENVTQIQKALAESQGEPAPQGDLSLLMGSDIMLTPEQLHQMLEDYTAKKRKKRAFHTRDDYRWPNGVVHYTIDSSVSSAVRSLIDEAVAYYESHTCLKFQYYNLTTDPQPSYYIYIIGDAGCWSYLGYQGSSGSLATCQLLSLAAGCNTISTVEHQFGLAIGMNHEHLRIVRDASVRILWDNVISSQQYNLDKCSPDNRVHGYYSCTYNPDDLYDFGSIMHYPPDAYSKNGLRTIEAVDSENQDTMGVANQHLSFLDTKLINTVYCSLKPYGDQQVPSPCANSTATCENGGYLNPTRDPPTSCAECICPDPWSKPSCTSRGGDATCGGDLNAAANWQSLEEPSMSETSKCVWFIKSPENTKIDYKFNYIGLAPAGGYETCDFQYVEVKYTDWLNTGRRFCHNATSSQLTGWTIPTNLLAIIVQSYSSTGNDFSLSYRIQPKNCTFNNYIHASFLDGGTTTSCTGQSCIIHSGTTALLTSCSPVVLKTTSDLTGTTLTPDLGNSYGGKIHLNCSAGGTITATGFTGGAQIIGVTSVNQTKACCLVSKMAKYSNKVSITFSPQTPIGGTVYGAAINNCYKVDKAVRKKSLEEVCEGVHRLKSVTNNIVVECSGTPGQPGTWANFPGCIPLSGPGGNAVSTPVHQMDRLGGGIFPPTPIKGITSPQECSQRCRGHETGGRFGGQFGCVAYAYLDENSPFVKSTCWLKEFVPIARPPWFRSLIPHIWSGVFEGTIQCNNGTILPCKKWCDGVSDCPGGDDELGCPEPCNTIHTAANNACGSALAYNGTTPVEGGKYFQCSPGKCVPCSYVCDKQLWGRGNIEHCPGGLDEATTICAST